MILNLILFFAAWFLAQIAIEIIKGAIRQHQAKKIVDEIYLKASKLILAAIKDGARYERKM